MHRNQFVRSEIILLFVLCLFLNCGKKDRNYTVDIEHGIKYVNNISAKWGNTPKIHLRLIRNYGTVPSRSGPYHLPGIQDFYKDPQGNLYIINGTNREIVKYSQDGRILSTFGESEGASFKIPYCIEIDDDDNIFIGDRINKSIKIFTEQGIEQDTVNLNRFLHYFWRLGDFRLLKRNKILVSGEISTIPSAFVVEDSITIFKIINEDGELAGEFLNAEFYEYESSCLQINKVFFDIHENSDLFITYKFRNRIEKRSSSGEIIFAASRPINISETVFSVKNNQIVYPNQISKGIGIDFRKRIWICTLTRELDDFESRNKYDSITDHLVFHVFNEDGIFLGGIPVPMNFQKIRIFGDRILFINRQRSAISEYQILEN